MKIYLGRVYRDILRKILDDPDLHAEFHEELELTERILEQQRQDKDKLYSIHAPEVECITKGKVHKKYEFGVKVSVATTNRDNFVVGMQALPLIDPHLEIGSRFEARPTSISKGARKSPAGKAPRRSNSNTRSTRLYSVLMASKFWCPLIIELSNFR